MDNDSRTFDINLLLGRYETLCTSGGLVCPTKRYVSDLIANTPDLMIKADFYCDAPNKPAVLASKKVVNRIVCETHFGENDYMPDVLTEAARRRISEKK